ncbi:disulfide bond formation protein B [Candidatus Blochmanniella floridana]|uniref:Disulfide bond formation protein B n=1 Tax=Blochmanniella floridana TaxID=203907 RepID=DSBB_BLOFL|nr:RecName: Full=Disulfide bond formation protein B; AltName: Full=Disulfide oxidoreductase [Candidatus Blochmannia floridanus]CAD83500.1 disulfide bond formation protein B [Candidatus Blochmannia floridanus]
MLHIFYIYSKSRKFWAILICSSISLISIALLNQFFFLLKPCILCIYQRCSLFGITIAGLIALISPKTTLLRLFSIFIWLYSAIKGLYFSNIHMQTTLHPSSSLTCDLFVSFPNWLPLNKWYPIIFDSKISNCYSYPQYLLYLEISQWMLLFFLIYLIIAIFTIISQCHNLFQKK